MFGKDKTSYYTFKNITGKYPNNLSLYKQSVRHRSLHNITKKGVQPSYERLEYLGDAILGMIVAGYLYEKYPLGDEGFLTEIRSKIVNKESLNHLAQKIGIDKIIQHDKDTRIFNFGDCLEAIIGAIYLDQGFEYCKKFVIEKLIQSHFDDKKLVTTIFNYKSKLLEWSQREKKEIVFKISDRKNKKFISQVFIDGRPMAVGVGSNKKKAHQEASFKTCRMLNIDKYEKNQ